MMLEFTKGAAIGVVITAIMLAVVWPLAYAACYLSPACSFHESRPSPAKSGFVDPMFFPAAFEQGV